jgi:hypothetical protein
LEKYTAFKASLLQYIEEFPNPAFKQRLPNIAIENFLPISNAFVAVGSRWLGAMPG